MSELLRFTALVVLFTVFFTLMYGRFPTDEHSSWLKELVWWGMTLGWISTLGLAVLFGYKYWQEILALLGGIKADRKKDQNEEVKRQMKRFDKLIKTLGEAEVVSKEVLQSTVLQANALADVIVSLHNRALELQRRVDAYNHAFEALAEGDPLKIVRAAGGVENDLRILMTTPTADQEFYHQAARSVAERQSNAQEWVVQYQVLRNDLMGMLTGIRVRLAQVRAHGEAAHAAQPLLLAERNLTRAYDALKLGVNEKPTLQIEGLSFQYLDTTSAQLAMIDER